MVAVFMRLFQRNRLAEGYVGWREEIPMFYSEMEVIGQIPQKGQKNIKIIILRQGRTFRPPFSTHI